MHRISCRFTVVVGLLALLGTGLLAGCGNTTLSAPALPSSTADGGTDGPDSSSNTPDSALVQTPPSVAPMSPGAGEQPQALPGGPQVPALGPRETAYLNSLRQAGVTPGDNEAEISVARMICWSVDHNQSPDQLQVFVNAVAGSDAKEAGKPVNDGDVGKLGQVYIDTARATYC